MKTPLLLAALSLLAGCGPLELHQDINRDGLVFCSEGNPESFNPQLDTSGTTVDATSAQLYDRLIEYDAEQQTFVPSLAHKWETFDGGRRYRFHLRPNVQFHQTDWFTPTRPLQASDVVFSFTRWLDPHHDYHKVNGGQYPFFRASGLMRLIERVESVNSTTVDFVLTRVDSSFLANLATDFAVILSAEYAQQLTQQGTPELLDRHPIGTGPFQFIEFRKDLLIRYGANANYWQGAPAIKHLVYSITPNANKRMLKLITGECDVIAYPLVTQLEQRDHKPPVKVTQTSSPNIAFWAFNTERPPFDQALVRQALAHAINRPAIVQTIYNGQAQLATGMLPSTSWAYQPTATDYPYDPKRARELLRQAGYPNGFAMTIWAAPIQRVYNPNALRMAELIQADLAQIGVTASIVSYEWNTFRQRLARGEHDTALVGWVADNADPDNFLRPTLSCSAARSGTNRALWCDADFDQQLLSAIQSTDPQDRQRRYQAIETYVMQQVPLVPIASSLRFQAHQHNIFGVELPPYGGIRFVNARRAEHVPL